MSLIEASKEFGKRSLDLREKKDIFEGGTGCSVVFLCLMILAETVLSCSSIFGRIEKKI